MEAGNVGQRWGERGGSLGGVQRGPGPSAGGREALSACGAFYDCACGGGGRGGGSNGGGLAGRSDQLGIVRWGRKLSREALAELGILRGRVPAPSVWSELFRALDVGALERLLGAWVKGAGAAGHVAIDGKRLRGSAVGDVPGVHLLAAFSERLQGVIGQLRVA